MARNKYRKYEFEGTFICGHEGTIEQGGYTREYTENVAENSFNSHSCPECEEKEKQEQYKKEAEIAEEKAKELGFPDLEGSEKQVQWALNIRKELSDKAPEIIDNADDRDFKYLQLYFKEYFNEDDDILKIRIDIREALNDLLKNKKSSTFYIDNNWKVKKLNLESIIEIVKKYLPKQKAIEQKEKEEKEKAEELKKEQTIYPENYNEIDITIKADDYIKIKTPQYKIAMATIRDYGYRWNNPYWVKLITKFTGNTSDRIAEIANKLLSEGYGVRFNIDSYKETQEKAIKGDFEPETTRWIVYSSKHKKLKIYINWADGLYKEAKKLPGAKWIKGEGMSVPLTSYKSVLDFADLYDYKLSDGAKEEIKKHQESMQRVAMNVVEKEEFDKNKKLKEILSSNTDVIDDLKDN